VDQSVNERNEVSTNQPERVCPRATFLRRLDACHQRLRAHPQTSICAGAEIFMRIVQPTVLGKSIPPGRGFIHGCKSWVPSAKASILSVKDTIPSVKASILSVKGSILTLKASIAGAKDAVLAAKTLIFSGKASILDPKTSVPSAQGHSFSVEKFESAQRLAHFLAR
jgi:hypothetical protein